MGYGTVRPYEKIPDQTAPGPARGRVAKSNPAFPGTVFLKITSMGNLSENWGYSIYYFISLVLEYRTWRILCSAHSSDF